MYLKPTKTFRLTKRNKTLLAILPFADADTRAAFKAMMVQAQIQGSQSIKREVRRDVVTGQPAPDAA
jgi:hypothetical protein